MTLDTAHQPEREPEAELWFAVVGHRLGHLPAAVMDTAEALADRCDEHGHLIPSPTVEQTASWAGRPRTAVRRALSALMVAGLVVTDDLGTRLTVPGPGHDTTAAPAWSA